MTTVVFRALALSALLVTAFLFSIAFAPPPPAHAGTLTVNTLMDQTDGSCSDGTCSLRDAMALADSTAGPDTIQFGVAGTITVSATLGCLPPLENNDTTIDGTTAPGYTGTPLVEITAETGLSCGITTGIHIDGDENVLRGLVIHSFTDDCIAIDSGSLNVIGPHMVISDCHDGVNIGGPAWGNRIEDSFIGTNLTGTEAWGNVGAGIDLNAPEVGGPTMTDIVYNVISGNVGDGILLDGENTHENNIAGNHIGVAIDTVSPLGNGGAGIRIADGAYDNYIGGALLGDPNVIAYNGGATIDTGIVITDDDSDGNRISHNSIYGNIGLGIDLGEDGVTCNALSGVGPNDLIHCPVITSATTTLVSGTTCPGCIVEVFIADPDPTTGYGEGKTHLGDTTADQSGNFAVPVSGVKACDWLTATASEALVRKGTSENTVENTPANTSEFGRNVQVSCGSQEHRHARTATPAPTPTATPVPTKTPLPPPPPPTGAPSSGVGPAVLPPATGQGPTPDGASWLGLALLLGAGSALAIGIVYLRPRKGKRRG